MPKLDKACLLSIQMRLKEMVVSSENSAGDKVPNSPARHFGAGQVSGLELALGEVEKMIYAEANLTPAQRAIQTAQTLAARMGAEFVPHPEGWPHIDGQPATARSLTEVLFDAKPKKTEFGPWTLWLVRGPMPEALADLHVQVRYIQGSVESAVSKAGDFDWERKHAKFTHFDAYRIATFSRA